MRLPTVGTVFIDRYKLVEVLGEGGFATVFRAIDTSVDRQVAVKVLTPDEDGYEQSTVSRFMREGRVLATLRDPHTITMFDFGRSDSGLLYMVFEYVAGVDLSKILAMRGPFDEPTTIHVLRQLLGALHEAHTAGVLHRDLKPANVLVYEYMGDDARVTLIDFGIAKPVVSTPETPGITVAGTMVGTPRYMSPEQLFDQDVGPASDVFSLGLIVYEMLVGRPAVQGNHTHEMMAVQLDSDPFRLPEQLDIRPGFRAIVECMLERELPRRYPSAEAVLEALDRLDPPRRSIRMAAAPVPRQPVQADESVAESLSDPRLMIGAGLVTIATVAVGLLLLTMGDEEPTGAPSHVVPSRVERLSPPPTPSAVDEPADPEPASPPPSAVQILRVDAGAPAADTGPCGGEPPFVGTKKRTTSVRDGMGSWLTYVPKNYDSSRAYGLILLFHGATSNGQAALDQLGLVPRVADHDYIVIAPDSPDFVGPWRRPSDMDLVEGAIESTREEFCVAPGQIFAVGTGSGARMAERVGCEIELAAIASTAFRQRPGEPTCEPDHPHRLLLIEGRNDPYLPAEGGASCSGIGVISREEKLEWGRERNGCTKASTPWKEPRKRGTCEEWSCDTQFVSCLVHGGHNWPGEKPGLFPPCSSIPSAFDYVGTVLEFFDDARSALESPDRDADAG